MKVKCPAKINLFVEVLNKRKDNYHNVLLLNQTINLYDFLFVKKTKLNQIVLTCSNPLVPIDETNSVYKACIHFFNYYKINNRGITIHIEKNIPIQGGLGGESTDVWGILKALYKIYNIKDTMKNKILLAIKIGSDVPFFIYGGRCKVSGKGDKIKKLKKSNNYYVLIKPDFGQNTSESFKKIDLIKRKTKKKISIGYNAFEMVSDKTIQKIKNDLLKNNAVISMMSGSGTTVFGVFPSKKLAKKAFLSLKSKYENVYLCKDVFL